MKRGNSLYKILLLVAVLCAAFSALDAAVVPVNVIDDSYTKDARVPYSFGYNEDADLDARALITKYGYRGETHKVATRDGYILEMHRVTGPKSNPRPDGKKVIFLMHGLLCSSVDWLISGREKAFAYMLADEGYDVWLGNARGNHYSRKHKKHSVLDKDFWMFSWHEIGVEDLPAMIDYVRDKTGRDKIFYAGHSQGTTAFFVMASERPEYNEKITAMFALAPVAYTHHMTSPFFQVLARFDNLISGSMAALGLYEFEPTEDLIKEVQVIACDEDAWTQPLCENVLFLVAGFGTDQLNKTLLPAILGHVPAGASVRQLVHYAQLIKSDKFRQYDHGFIGNYLKYKRRTPPLYDLSKITAPVILHYSVNDWLSNVKDVNRLATELPNVYARLRVPNPRFAHLDYIWGVDADRLLYSKSITMMDRFED